MDNTSIASKVLAPCYPLTSISEECASSLVATQKRREELTAKNPPSQGEGASKPLTLRPYQSAAVQNLRLSLAGGVIREMLCSPTGSGKTEMGMALVRGARAKRKRVIFLCNRVHLVEQTSRRFKKAGIDHGIIQGENTARVYESVLVGSIQTVARRGMPDVDLIIIDEAHTVAGSREYRAVLAAAKGVPVIGLSATPYARGLGKHYDELGGALFEHMTVAATIPELIEGGYLVDCDVYAPSEPDMAGIKQARNAFGDLDYTDADVGRAVNKPELVGDIVTHWLRLARGTPTVCFAANIAHSKHIVERFHAAGVSAEHIDCYTDEEERRAILARVETGETMVISNVGILAEGWDFPACRTLILARPTRSLIRYIQMAGRVLRPHASKDRALILDHSGSVVRLGFPTDEFPLELDDGTPREAKGEAQEKEKPLPKACPSCSYVKTVHKCPVCGFAPERKANVDVRAGDLVPLKKKPKAKKMDKQEFYSQLLGVAQEKGRQPGWVAHRYRDYFGVWPRGMQNVPTAPTDEVRGFLIHLQIKAAKGKEARDAGA
ncbi:MULTISPECIES: DEAD/DEAH box helicase [unclassified Massilia]|uniref:DEAD/DEAH box helicase n=1 Tax=unclassified Massilia TaxID=2609279 RepID=UPI0009E94285|nr:MULTISPECIES: DEAD/DEAH box helicase [unclassified Massilia]